jgi:YHS domain-containing protein
MIFLSVIALTAMMGHQDAVKPPLTCAVLGINATDGGPAVDYNGVRYALCCAMCQASFQKDPAAAINGDKAKGKTIGTFMFDPVSDARITDAQAKAWSDYKGVRYLFLTPDEKTTFDATPVKFTAVPAKEALFCPVESQKLSGYAAAGSFRDYEGVRYYFCCNGCPADFAKKPADYAKVAAAYVTAPKAIIPAPEKKAADKTAAFEPQTFACIHCGKQITANSADDMNATCSVCGCGKKNSDCKG